MRMRMHSKSGIVNGLFPDRNRLIVKKVYPYENMEDGLRYKDKVIIITGGSSGIGKGCVKVFGKQLTFIYPARGEKESTI